MEELYVVRRKDREVYKNSSLQNTTNRYSAYVGTKQKALNIKNSVKATERGLWDIYPADEEFEASSTINTMRVSEEKFETIKNVIDSEEELKALTKDICSTFAAIDEIQKEAIREQSEADLALSDIYHFIEFTDNLNLAQTYKVMKLLKEVLKKRRKAKDKIAIANIYDASNVSDITNGKLNERVNSMFERQYSYRIIQDLHGIVTMPKEEFNELIENLHNV